MDKISGEQSKQSELLLELLGEKAKMEFHLNNVKDMEEEVKGIKSKFAHECLGDDKSAKILKRTFRLEDGIRKNG